MPSRYPDSQATSARSRYLGSRHQLVVQFLKFAVVGVSNTLLTLLVYAFLRRLQVLDVTQATESLGKTAGKDATARKATYPGLLGIDPTRRLSNELRQTAIDALSRIAVDTEASVIRLCASAV